MLLEGRGCLESQNAMQRSHCLCESTRAIGGVPYQSRQQIFHSDSESDSSAGFQHLTVCPVAGWGFFYRGPDDPTSGRLPGPRLGLPATPDRSTSSRKERGCGTSDEEGAFCAVLSVVREKDCGG